MPFFCCLTHVKHLRSKTALTAAGTRWDNRLRATCTFSCFTMLNLQPLSTLLLGHFHTSALLNTGVLVKWDIFGSGLAKLPLWQTTLIPDPNIPWDGPSEIISRCVYQLLWMWIFLDREMSGFAFRGAEVQAAGALNRWEPLLAKWPPPWSRFEFLGLGERQD